MQLPSAGTVQAKLLSAGTVQELAQCRQCATAKTVRNICIHNDFFTDILSRITNKTTWKHYFGRSQIQVMMIQFDKSFNH